MSYKTDDLARLTKYAQGLGLTVTVKLYKGGGTGAEWTTDGQEIVLYKWAGQSRTRMVLNLLHELGHHLAFVHDGRKVSKKLEDALYAEAARKPGSRPISKDKRKLIYNAEAKDAGFRHLIAKEVNLKLPMHKLNADIEIDMWDYARYYETGEHASAREIREMQKQLRAKYKEQK